MTAEIFFEDWVRDFSPPPHLLLVPPMILGLSLARARAVHEFRSQVASTAFKGQGAVQRFSRANKAAKKTCICCVIKGQAATEIFKLLSSYPFISYALWQLQP